MGPDASPSYQVFLSYRTSDNAAVEGIAGRLVDAGVVPWLDRWNLVPGQPWQPEIESALEKCDACAVFIGSDPLGPWQHQEMRAAIARQVNDRARGLRVIPVLLPGAGKPDAGRMPPFLALNLWVEFHDTLDDPQALHRLICGIKGVAPGPGPRAKPG